MLPRLSTVSTVPLGMRSSTAPPEVGVRRRFNLPPSSQTTTAVEPLMPAWGGAVTTGAAGTEAAENCRKEALKKAVTYRAQGKYTELCSLSCLRGGEDPAHLPERLREEGGYASVIVVE